jgi:structural maintenance of chromosome 3 (chondroitin sulfate proteoglycan 6)
MATRAALDAEILEAEANAKSRAEELDEVRSQLEEIRHRMNSCGAELAAIEPEFDRQSAEVARLAAENDLIKSQIEGLYGKQGRGRQFKTKKERDSFLSQQIQQLTAQIGSSTSILQRQQMEIIQEEGRLAKERELLSRADTELNNKNQRIGDLSQLIQQHTVQRNHFQEQRKACWREQETLREQIDEATASRDKAKHHLNAALPRQISIGLQIVEKYATDHSLDGYYGPLIDNFVLRDEKFKTCVEVASGNALFHVIVDTDSTAALLMKELERRKAGRLTFLPLNRLRNPTIQYPTVNDAYPMMQAAMTYKPEFEEAIKQVRR